MPEAETHRQALRDGMLLIGAALIVGGIVVVGIWGVSVLVGYLLSRVIDSVTPSGVAITIIIAMVVAWFAWLLGGGLWAKRW